MKIVYEENDLAIVTTKSGYEFVAVYTLAPGIDYFWSALIREDPKANNQLADPIVSVEHIGKLQS